jgi:hypothetical protein
MSDVSKPKRTVGRPRKKPLKTAMPVNGISTTPNIKSPDMAMEFIYGHPEMLKKIFNYYKVMSTDNLTINFKKDKIEIRTRNHSGEVWVQTEINCHKLNHYYCSPKTSTSDDTVESLLDKVDAVDADDDADELLIGLDPEGTEKVFSTIDKSTDRVTILSYAESKGMKIIVVLEDDDWKAKDIHDVFLVRSSEIPPIKDIKYTEEDYDIEFTLNAKKFKKIVSDMKVLADRFCIKKNPDQPVIGPEGEPVLGDDGKPLKKYAPLQLIRSATTTTKIMSRLAFEDPELINFKSKIEGNEVIEIPAKVENVQQLTKALICENLTIMASPKHDYIQIKGILDDGVATIKTFIKVDRYKTH